MRIGLKLLIFNVTCKLKKKTYKNFDRFEARNSLMKKILLSFIGIKLLLENYRNNSVSYKKFNFDSNKF